MTNFEIIETLAVLSERDRAGFQKELNVISWGGRKPKYDIRGWSDDHEKMTKGIILSEEEFIKIAQAGLESIGGK